MQSLGHIFISSCNKTTKKRGLFSFVEGNRQTSSSCNQCRYADGGEYIHSEEYLVPLQPLVSLALKTMKMIGRKLVCESIRFFGLLVFLRMKQEQEKTGALACKRKTQTT